MTVMSSTAFASQEDLDRRYDGSFSSAWQKTATNGKGASLTYGYNTWLTNEDYAWADHTTLSHMAKLTLRKKIIIYIALAILFLFLVYNVVWFINYKSYDKFIDDEYVKSSHSMSSYSKKAGESTYTVKKPDYLQLTGNLAIDNADSSVGIIIWPSFMQKSIKDYGLTIYDTEADIGYMIYVDENMRYDTLNRTGLSQNSEVAAKDLLNKLQGKVEELYQLMRNEFGLKG